MSCAAWNVRGINGPLKQKAVSNFITSNKVAIIGLLETKARSINVKNVGKSIRRSWEFVSNHRQSLSGRILIMWDPSLINFQVISSSDQAIHGQVKLMNGPEVFVSFIYGECIATERRRLWADLAVKARGFSHFPWLLIGDFNVCRDPMECSNLSASGSMHDFNNCINTIEVEDIRQIGFRFTWTNKRSGDQATSKKLDRALGNWEWFKLYNHCQASFLPQGISDHSPILVQWLPLCFQGGKPLKFLNYWAQHKDFKCG
ncbi:Exo_endo_phos domain-containing protein [Cephalotus follicularis]|uniref:Exo_endo_phos domain-containing protein n=1 Tax=Cephalotus follicularis TaxID=3775 RepID=A0A1Q3DBY9_CEPFO|nr:Exo_endo_phos domain-containing protein [Cephalotus follicularis]